MTYNITRRLRIYYSYVKNIDNMTIIEVYVIGGDSYGYDKRF